MGPVCSGSCSQQSEEPKDHKAFLIPPRVVSSPALILQPAVFANQSRNKLFVPHIIIISASLPRLQILTQRLENNLTNICIIPDGFSSNLHFQNKTQVSEC